MNRYVVGSAVLLLAAFFLFVIHADPIPVSTVCPTCGSEQRIPIMYGKPGPGTIAQAERGEIVLGGCSIFDDSPRWQCRQCGTRWGIYKP
jgi:hypothetical protein